MAIVTASLALVAASTGPLRAEDTAVEIAPDPGTEGEPDMWAGGSPDFCEACGGEVIDGGADPAEGMVPETLDTTMEGENGAEGIPSELVDPIDGAEGGEPVEMSATGSDWVKRGNASGTGLMAPSRGEAHRLSTDPGQCDLSRDLLSCLIGQ